MPLAQIEIDELNSSNYSDDFPPYNKYLHWVFMSVLAAYIPLIIVSSTFVIMTVTYLQELRTTHNIILASISISDLVVAIVVIPIHLLSGIPHTRKIIKSNPLLNIFLATLVDNINITVLSLLTLLGIETLFKIKYPIKYRRHQSYNKARALILTITVLQLVIGFVFFGIKARDNFKASSMMNTLLNWEILFYQVTYTSMLLICFINGVWVRLISFKIAKGLTERLTTVILMFYILFYSPTIRLLFWYREMDDSTLECWKHLSRVSRYLSSATNGIFISLSRPVYKKAFKYFIKTNPRHWNKIQKVFTAETKRKTMKFIRQHFVFTASIYNVDEDEQAPSKSESIKSTWDTKSVESAQTQEEVQIPPLEIPFKSSINVSINPSLESMATGKRGPN